MKKGRARAPRLRHCDSGSTAVEFAFVGMLLIVGSVTIVDFGRAFWLYNKLSNALERTARMNLIQPIGDDQISAEIKKDFPAASDAAWAGAPRVTVTTGAEFRTVKAILPIKPVIPYFMGASLDLTLTRRFSKLPAPT